MELELNEFFVIVKVLRNWRLTIAACMHRWCFELNNDFEKDDVYAYVAIHTGTVVISHNSLRKYIYNILIRSARNPIHACTHACCAACMAGRLLR